MAHSGRVKRTDIAKVHFYASNLDYSHDGLADEGMSTFENYVGSITVETEYTLQAKAA